MGAALAVLASVVVAVYLRSEPDEPAGATRREMNAEDPGAASGEVLRGESNASGVGLEAEANGHSTSREAVDDLATLAHGRVTRADGQPIEAAEVTWTRLGLPLAAKGGGLANWDVLSKEVLRTQTDGFGAFEIPAVEGQQQGVLWISKLGFEPKWVAAGEQPSATLVGIELAARAPFEVFVQNPDGEPVANARVIQVGCEGFRFGGRSQEERYSSLLSFGRSGVTDDEGVALMHPGLHYTMLQALGEGGRLSRAWIHDGDKDGDRVVLTLNERVVAKGRLVGDLRLATPTVLVFEEREGGEGDFLAALTVEASGEIEPQALASSTSGEYRVRIEGPGLAPIVLGPLQPLEGIVRIDAAVTPSSEVLFKVVDPAGEPIEGAKVVYGWPAPGGDVVWVRAAYYSGADGLVEVPCPEGPIFPLVTHPDFSDLYDAEGVIAPSPEGEFYEVTLEHFGAIEGVVTRLGEPVPDFKVLRFSKGPELDMRVVSFSEKADGGFSIPKALGGIVTLFVVDEETEVQSPPLEVAVRPGETVEVEIELPAGVLGRGRLMDGDGRVPEGANVVRQLHTGTRIRWNAESTALPNASGEFHVPGLSGDNERVSVEAPGYSPVFLEAFRSSDGQYDFGVALLEPLSSLDVEVLLPTGVAPGECYVEASGAFWDGPAQLDEQGRVRFGRSHAGVLTLSTTIQGKPVADYLTRLSGTGPWTRTLDFSQSGTVRVELVGAPELLSKGVGVGAVLDGGGIYESRSLYMETDTGVAQFLGLPLAPVEFSAYDLTTYVRLGHARITPGMLDEVTLRLEVDGESWNVLVVDPQGDPVAGTSVRLVDPEATEFSWSATTGDDGIAMLGPASAGSRILAMTGPSGEQVSGVIVIPAELASPFQVVLDASACLELDIRDGSSIPEGVQFWLFDAYHSAVLGWPTVGPSGHISLCQLGQGDYLLEPQSSLLWRERKLVHCDGTGEFQEVQFRRKASLRVAVENAYGKPAEGSWVSLRSVEYGTDVSEWLDEGRVESVTGLVTDADGLVEVTGVPRGLYAWSVGGQAGEVDAPALGVGVVEVKLAPL